MIFWQARLRQGSRRWFKQALIGFCLALTLLVAPDEQAWAQRFSEQFPLLDSYRAKPKETGFYFGFGLAPIAYLNHTPDVAISLGQLHWRNDFLHWEVVNAMLGLTYLNANSELNVIHYTFRSSLQLRLGKVLSFGPLVGWEFLSFPNVQVQTTQNNYITPQLPLATGGLIYGALLSEVFPLQDRYQLKINQVFYAQHYSTTLGAAGWSYVYNDPLLQADSSPIAAGIAVMVDFNLIF